MSRKVSTTPLELECGVPSLSECTSRHPDASFLLPFVEVESATYFLLQAAPKHGLHMLGGKKEVGENHASCLFRELSEELGRVCFSEDELSSFPLFELRFNTKGSCAEATVSPIEVSFEFANSMMRLPNLEHPLVLLPLKEYLSGRSNERISLIKLSEVTQHALRRF